MSDRPYILLNCAMSIDGYLDDASDSRLVLSTADDFDRVDELRADVDAILVGANTVRRDNPRLQVRSPARRAAREAAGRPPTPLRVTLTGSGDLPPDAAFFAGGDTLVYAPGAVEVPGTVVAVGEPVELGPVLADLAARGVRSMLVEGGGVVLTAFLTAGLADELQLAIAPFFVGDSRAPRFIHDGQFRWTSANRATLAEVRAIGNLALHRYLLTPSAVDRHWLARAIELSLRCPPSTSAFSVGAVIVDAGGNEIASGYSRETDDTTHAEESALAKLGDDPRLAGATLYSSLEPCSRRKSRPRPCAGRILDAGIARVVFALREPSTFVVGEGAELLTAGGVDVMELADLGPAVREANRHLLS